MKLNIVLAATLPNLPVVTDLTLLLKSCAMLAKFAASAALVFILGTICTTAVGQQAYYEPNVGAVSFSRPNGTQDQETQKLKATVRMMELRLVELENDVANKLDSKSSEDTTDASKVVDERLSKLEEGFEEQDKAVEKLEDAAPEFVIHGHKSPNMKITGRIHADYWAFPNVAETLFPLEGGNPQDRSLFRRARIGFSGDLTDNMFYKLEVDFAVPALPAEKDMYIGFKNLPILRTVIIGNQKRPYGLDVLNSSRNNVFLERPFINEAFNQDARRMGTSSNGYSKNEKYNWRFGVWNQALTQTLGGYIGDHYQLEFAARLASTPWYDECSGGRGYAHFAISGMAGTPDGRTGILNNQAEYRTRPEARTTRRWLNTGRISGANANSLIGLESVINIGSFNWTTEYMRNNVDRRDAVGEDVALDGVYTQFSYLLTGEHHPWNRQTGTLGRLKPHENFFRVRDCDGNRQIGKGAWEVAFRYSHADFNDYDILGGDVDSYTFGLNWYWSPYARMQFNYILGDFHSGPNAAGQGNYQIAGVRVSANF